MGAGATEEGGFDVSAFDRFVIAAALGAGSMAIPADIARAEEVRRAEAAFRERLDVCACGAAPHGVAFTTRSPDNFGRKVGKFDLTTGT